MPRMSPAWALVATAALACGMGSEAAGTAVAFATTVGRGDLSHATGHARLLAASGELVVPVLARTQPDGSGTVLEAVQVGIFSARDGTQTRPTATPIPARSVKSYGVRGISVGPPAFAAGETLVAATIAWPAQDRACVGRGALSFPGVAQACVIGVPAGVGGPARTVWAGSPGQRSGFGGCAAAHAAGSADGAEVDVVCTEGFEGAEWTLGSVRAVRVAGNGSTVASTAWNAPGCACDGTKACWMGTPLVLPRVGAAHRAAGRPAVAQGSSESRGRALRPTQSPSPLLGGPAALMGGSGMAGAAVLLPGASAWPDVPLPVGTPGRGWAVFASLAPAAGGAAAAAVETVQLLCAAVGGGSAVVLRGLDQALRPAWQVSLMQSDDRPCPARALPGVPSDAMTEPAVQLVVPRGSQAASAALALSPGYGGGKPVAWLVNLTQGGSRGPTTMQWSSDGLSGEAGVMGGWLGAGSGRALLLAAMPAVAGPAGVVGAPSLALDVVDEGGSTRRLWEGTPAASAPGGNATAVLVGVVRPAPGQGSGHESCVGIAAAGCAAVPPSCTVVVSMAGRGALDSSGTTTLVGIDITDGVCSDATPLPPRLASPSPTPLPSNSPAPTPGTSGQPRHSPHTSPGPAPEPASPGGAIAGGVIGGVAVLAIAGFFARRSLLARAADGGTPGHADVYASMDAEDL